MNNRPLTLPLIALSAMTAVSCGGGSRSPAGGMGAATPQETSAEGSLSSKAATPTKAPTKNIASPVKPTPTKTTITPVKPTVTKSPPTSVKTNSLIPSNQKGTPVIKNPLGISLICIGALAPVGCGGGGGGSQTPAVSTPAATSPISTPTTTPTPAASTTTPTTPVTTPTTTPTTSTLATAYARYTNGVVVTQSSGTVTLKSGGVPDHKSPYFSRTDARYEAYNGTNPNWSQNPNSISSQNFEIRIPASPVAAAAKRSTSLGPIGMALNGVPLFNQYAGPNQPLTNEINSFDQYNGHPQQTGMYHYHVEPLWLTAKNGKDSLIGFLLDGFPVYGPVENGKTLTSASLDSYHGHSHATTDYPQGIYHYHITSDSPYINGGQYYGTPGTTTN